MLRFGLSGFGAGLAAGLGDVLGEIMVEKNKSRTSVSQYFPFIGLRAVLHA